MFVNSFSRAHDLIVAFVPEKAPSMFLDVVVRKVLADVNRKKHTHTHGTRNMRLRRHTHTLQAEEYKRMGIILLAHFPFPSWWLLN